MTMDCRRVAGLLPWHLNGTLKGDEADQVRAHLERCPRCRAGLAETGLAAEIFSTHPAAEALLDHLEGRTGPGVVASHIEACPACADEIGRARASRAGLGLPNPARASEGTGATAWWRPALAAGLGAVLAGLALWGAGEARIGAARLEADRLRAEIARLEAAPRESHGAVGPGPPSPAPSPGAQAPLLNFPIIELLPQAPRRGDAPLEIPSEPVPAEAPAVALLLQPPPGRGCTRCTVEIVDAAGGTIWRSEGLVLQATGDYTVLLPTEVLRPGQWVLRLTDEKAPGEPIALYAVVVR